MNLVYQLLPIVVLFAVFYFVVIRPENKRKKEYSHLLSNLKVNDQIMTRGGIIGKIVSLDEENIVVETSSDRTKIKFSKNAVANLVSVKVKEK